MHSNDATRQTTKTGESVSRLRRLVLDVLKPHQPSVLELGNLLAKQGELRVKLTVTEMDDKTETLQIELAGADIDFEQILETINKFGASLHSIDEVEVDSRPQSTG